MLSIVGTTTDTVTGSLAVASGPLFDFYPYERGVPDPLHWRLGDFKFTLLDLTIRGDGAIVGVTLTIFAGLRLDAAPTSFETAGSTPGVPLVDRAGIKSSRVDERYDLSLYLGLDQAYLVLDQDVEGAVCVTTDRVGFFVANKRLVGIGFNRLLADERRDVLEILEGVR